LYLIFTTSMSNLGIVRSNLRFTLSNLGIVRSNLRFTLSNLGIVRSNHLLILYTRSVIVLVSDLWRDGKAEASRDGRKLRRATQSSGESFPRPCSQASAFSKHAADIRNHLQEMLSVLRVAEVAVDCDGRQQEVSYTLCEACFADALLT
jgi:hypothetical protein